MFGFPTRARNLYDQKVTSRRALESAVVSDRPLDMAVSAFSPGAQIVRDGLLHTAVGFAHYEIKGKQAYPADPLGPAIPVGACGACQTTFIRPQAEQCPVCSGGLHLFDLYQPRGFRTSYQPRDYDDSTDTASHAGIPALSAVDEAKHRAEVAALTLEVYEQAQVLQVNDNRGELFPLRRLTDGSVVVSDDAVLPLKNLEGTPRQARISMPRRSASSGPPTLSSSAWTGRTCRQALSSAHDRSCPPGEPRSGPSRRSSAAPAKSHSTSTRRNSSWACSRRSWTGTQSFRVFLADALDNGAGYAVELGKPEVFARILDRRAAN